MDQETKSANATDQSAEGVRTLVERRVSRRKRMARSMTGLFGVGALASGVGALRWGARPVLGQGADDDELHKITGQGGMVGEVAHSPAPLVTPDNSMR